MASQRDALLSRTQSAGVRLAAAGPAAATARAVPRSPGHVVVAIFVAALVSGAMPTQAAAVSTNEAKDAPTARILIVDNGERQCQRTPYTTISAAVRDANAGDEVRVCPGLYVEQVTVTKPLTIRGDAETVEAVDCFSPTHPTTDPSTQAIVAAPADAPAVLFDLQADSIELQGLVLEGSGGASRAVVTSAEYSGYRIHHNLIVAHTVAATFRSSGALPSSFHHNCLRENGWGLANEWAPLIDARVHHNETFRIGNYSFEQTPACAPLPCTSPSIGMDRVTFDHNISRETEAGYRLAFSGSTTVFENTVTSARIGMRLVGGNQALEIVENHLEVGQVGIPQQSTPRVPSNIGVLIQGNTITGAGTAAGIGMGAAALKDSSIIENTISGLAGEGIALLAGNTGNLVRGNVVENNRRDGIRAAAGATGNTFEFNQMHGNGRTVNADGTVVVTGVDARDGARELNIWRGNECETDDPAGTICGVP